MSIFMSCPFILGGLVCLFAGLVLGMRSIFVIRQSKGRLRGYGHAIVAIVISAAMLLGFPVLMFTVTVSKKHFGGTAQTGPGPTSYRSLGKGKSAAEHGPRCQDFQAAKAHSADMYKSAVLEAIAERGDLTTHEQMHLVDVVIDDISSDIYRRDVLVLLARNTALTPDGRAYLIANLDRMSSDIFRSEVVEALQERPPAKE